MERIRDLSSKTAAVIFTKSSCCMCHSIKTLFYELGASPAIHELDKDSEGREMERALQKGVVIFTKNSCCLCYAVQVLFRDLRVQPKIHEIDNDPDCREIEKALVRLGCANAVPAVFVSGKLVGSTNDVMSLHLSGSLVPLIKPYQSFHK
ncbi:hypothetical protein HID58_082805 [Brassica napus]|uniref:Glutaredoxin domain-containing protein n=1 Tax=Brassica napus TaxID=3708 RepID=A0ABQ7YBL4_BRANA|nr:hypothetical protein HID58_082805 [Brassica napus]